MMSLLNFQQLNSANAEFVPVAALLTILADPEAHRRRFEEIVAATDKHNGVLNDARAAQVKLEADTAASLDAIEVARKAAEANVDRQRTQIVVDAAATRQRAKDNDARAAELKTYAAALDEREADITRRETAFRTAAQAMA